jgi:hypothetical protein
MRTLDAFRRNYRSWAARRSTPLPFSQVAQGVWAKVQGIVQPMHGLATSPLTGDQGVVCVTSIGIKHHIIGEYGRHSVDWEWPPPVVSGSPFWLLDDDGRCVIVDPLAAIFKVPSVDVSAHPHVNDGGKELEALLALYGVPSTLFMGVGGEIQALETILHQGDRVAVAGIPTQRPGRTPDGSAYRDASATVMHFAHTPEVPLIILQARAA